MNKNLLPLAVALPFTLALPALQAQDKAPALATPAPLDLAAPLPTDPALVTGELPSGVRYIVRRHANPQGRAAVWMHVNTGSLNETDKQRGIAHYLEHMAFNGSEHFPAGTVVKFFEDLGLTFGRHQNAFTSFDQTAYQLFLGDNQPENLKKALTFMSDVAFRLTLDQKEIDSERQIILEEKRSRLSPQQRIQETMLKRLAPGSLVGERLPIGTEQTITGVMQQDFKDYWGKWYTPTNITVIVAADMDPQTVVQEITAQFGSEPKRPAPPAMDPLVRPYAHDDAAVVTDPEIKRAAVSLVKLSKAQPPITTVGAFRADLVDTIGAFAFNHRLATKLEQGKVSFINANAGSQTLFRVGRLAQAQVTAEPAKWQDAFKELCTELQRARLHGFTDRELADARTQIISSAEIFAKRESTTDARPLITRYNTSIADGEPIMSAQQTLDLLRAVLPTISAGEVSARFAAEFEPTNVLFTAELPSGPHIISEPDLIVFGKKALDVRPPAEAETARVAKILDKAPTPGKAESLTTHKAANVTSAWLPSGVRVHYRFMDTEKDSVTISISLANGAINETAANRGVSEAAALAWNNAATSKLTSTQIREFLIGCKASVRGGAGDDTMSLVVGGAPDGLDTALQVVYLLLTDPVLEKAEFDRWKVRTLQNIAQRKTQPGGILTEAIADSLNPKGEVRRRPLTAEQVNALTLEATQAWLNSVVATSPIEVSIVGDIPQDAAFALVEKYLGSLPTRERISAATLDDKRTIKREPGPRDVTLSVETQTPQAMVVDGFFGPDVANLRDVRLMQLASRILATRMTKVIREEKQLVYSMSPQFRPGEAWPGMGLFMAVAPTAPEKAPALGPAVTELYDLFAKDGPTDDELATALKQVNNNLAEDLKKPTYWTGTLSLLTYRDRNLDDTINAQAAYAAFKPADVREAFARYYTPEARVRFTILPKTPAAAPK